MIQSREYFFLDMHYLPKKERKDNYEKIHEFQP